MAASPHPPLPSNNMEDDHHHHHHHHGHGHSHSHTGHLLLHHHHQQQQQKHAHHENSADSSTSSDSSSDNNSENPNSTAATNHLPVTSIPPPASSSSITPPVASAVSSTVTAVPVSSSSANSAIAASLPVGISSANSAAASNVMPNSSTAIIPVNSSASNSAPIATAIPLLQFHPNQQQRLLSLHLSSSSSPPPPPPPPAAAAAPPTVKTLLALPIDATPLNVQNSAVISAIPDRHSRDDCWSEGATLTLIKAWGDRYVELNRGNLKQKHWKEVADCVNTRCSFNGAIKAPKTDVQCKNRLDTLKKKYKLEKSKILTGGGPSKWTFFEQLDELIGTSTKKPLLRKLSPSSKLQSQSAQPNSSPSSALRQIMPSSSALPSSATGTAMPSLQRPLESEHEALMAEQKHMQIHLIQPKHEYYHSSQKLHPPLTQPANPNLNPNVSPNPNPNLTFNDNLNTNPNHGTVDTDTLSGSKEHSADMAMAEDISCHDADADNNTVSAAHRLKRKRFYSSTTTRSASPQNSNNPIKILAKAIAKFGEVYERIEIAKHQQMMEMEKQRMEFTKELELQRLQLFMQTQVELAKLKHGGDNNKQSCNNNNNNNNNNNTEHYL